MSFDFLQVLPGWLTVKILPEMQMWVSSLGWEDLLEEEMATGRSAGGGNGNPLQHSCLGNPIDRGALWVTV